MWRWTLSSKLWGLEEAECENTCRTPSSNTLIMSVKDLGKLQIERRGGATGWQVGKQENTSNAKSKV